MAFSIANMATAKHKFVVIKTDAPEDQIPVDSSGAAGGQGKVHEVDTFAGPDVTKMLTLNLTPGRYMVICNVPGQYQKWMHTTLTVLPAGSIASLSR